jgi:hypothetical protein
MYKYAKVDRETELLVDRSGVLWEVSVMSVTSIFRINNKEDRFHELLITTEEKLGCSELVTSECN